MKILLVTDAWHPQKNGVVVTLSMILPHIRDHEVLVVHPGVATAKPALRIYHDVQLVGNPLHVVAKYLDAFEPDRIHLVTEGPLGIAGRWHCLRRGRSFTTSYHTRLPEYGWRLYGIPPVLSRTAVAWFHRRSRKVLVPTPSLVDELGYANAVVWGRGVDLERFYPEESLRSTEPTLLYVGRVSKEKNLEVFCALSNWRRLVVGDGPHRAALQRRYPDVRFIGHVAHDELRRWYTHAHAFVFPSRTDTFGLVLLEAMACCLPVVAYDVTGPKDIVEQGVTGYLGEDLPGNVARALARREELGRNALVHAQKHSWQQVARQFVDHVCNL
jgi:glycosyltransferase involved in cell wall biosynthesis